MFNINTEFVIDAASITTVEDLSSAVKFVLMRRDIRIDDLSAAADGLRAAVLTAAELGLNNPILEVETLAKINEFEEFVAAELRGNAARCIKDAAELFVRGQILEKVRADLSSRPGYWDEEDIKRAFELRDR